MRAKYKLTQTIKTAADYDGGEFFGTINGVLQREDGVQYTVSEEQHSKLMIPEESIEGAYRKVLPRQSKPRAAKGSRASKKSGEKSASLN